MKLESDDEMIDEINEMDLELEFPNEDSKECPLQLIDFEGQTFKVNEEALSMLKSIEEEIIVVSIVGKARTGKSYLMNLLLDNIGIKGFDVDSTISSCTKGIWLWGSSRKSQGSNSNNTKIIFIDSEGTSSIDRSTKTYDSKIFALVVLISSLFIYNTTANIDESGISELSLAAHLSNSIACNSNSSIEKDSLLTELAPKFIWVLRDFTLEKTHPDTGHEISNNEYLEICLRKKISGKNSAENNMIRDNIIKYFKQRECITLPRPVETEEELRNLKNIKFNELKPNFKVEFMDLKNKVYKETKPKKINGQKINGASLASLISEFVQAINSGVIPNINNAWDSVISQDIKGFYDKALNHFKEKLKNIFINKNNTGTENKITLIEIIQNLQNIKSDSLTKYNLLIVINPEILYSDNYKSLYEEHKSNLESEIKKIEEKIIKEETERKKKSNVDLLKSQYKGIVNLMFKNHYNIDNQNFGELSNDLVKILNHYVNNSDGLHSDSIKTLISFLNDNMKEVIYYIVTNTKSDYKIKINNMERKTLIINEEMKDLDNSNKKLEQINQVLDNRRKHLEKDNERKEKEIENLNSKFKSLLNNLQNIKLNREVRFDKDKDNTEREIIKSETYDREVRFDSNANKLNRNDCNCNCSIY